MRGFTSQIQEIRNLASRFPASTISAGGYQARASSKARSTSRSAVAVSMDSNGRDWLDAPWG